MKTLSLVVLAALVPGGNDETRPVRRRTLPLSTREAVSLSLNHNLDLEIARYQPWIEDQNVYATLGTWDHVVYANSSGGERISQPSNSLIDASRPDTDTADFALGVRKTLPFGASYDVSWSTFRTLTNNPFSVFNPRWSQSAGVSVVLPLLKGGSMAANTATLVIARHTREVSVDAFENTLADSVFLVMQGYWDLVFAIENQKVKVQSLDVAQRLLEDNRRQFAAGRAARIEVTQADAGVAAQQEGILTAEAAVLNAMDRLKRLIDPGLLKEEVSIVPVEAPRGLEGELDEPAAVLAAMQEALARRPELRQLRRQKESQDLSIVKARNDLLPRLDLTGRAFVNGTDDTLQGSGDKAYMTDFRDMGAGVVFEIPLEGRSARGALNRAELEKRRLDLQERNLENQILVELREAVRAIKTNEKRIEANRRARVLAQEQLDAEENRRREGLSTTFRVLDVQEDVQIARTNELKALIDYNLSLHKLEQAKGSLLEKNGILLRDNLQPRLALAGR